MTPRSLFILSGTTLLLGLGAVYGVTQTQRSERGETRPVRAFPELAAKSAEAARITIVAAKSKVTLNRDDAGTWHVAELGSYPAKPDLIRRLMVDLETLDLLDKRSARLEAQDV